jgi:serine/threonine-protein kinase
MPLAVGTRLGAYEIRSVLGAGGMGEVYRAHDPKLNRDIALKVLPELFAVDLDRVARFKREAQVLASLNHPHIAAIYGFEETNGVQALALELIEGPTLADRIAQGPIPVDEALPIARQISAALEAAHERGIIHRDLKPANIKLRPDGTVKVLDFGLAKALEPVAPVGGDATASPTITSPAMTQMGLILGTAAYMSPEQAKGRPTDKRSDVWSFGAVLHEMLSGQRTFKGDDIADTLAAVLRHDVDWAVLPAATPASVRYLLARCLERDVTRRLRDIGEARIQLDELMSGSVEQPASSHLTRRSIARRVGPAAIAALASSALTVALVLSVFRERAAHNPPLVSRFEIVPPPGQALGNLDFVRAIAVSPDGRFIVSVVRPERRQLAVRAINGLDVHLLTGTDSAEQPFVSPDSQWIGFFSSGSLKKVPASGGAAITIGPTSVTRGASWGDDGSIVFATFAGELMSVPAGGGEPTVLTRPDPSKSGARHWYPSTLPGGRGILFTITTPDGAESAQVAVLDLKTKQQKPLIRGGSQAEYIPSGHLVYAAANTLRAVRFDLERLQVLSDPVTVVDDVAMTIGGGAQYAFSRTGTLVYVPSRPQMARSLVWVDRKGQEAPIPAPARAYIEPRLSPNGGRIAVAIADQDNDIWLWDVTRGGPLTQLTIDPSLDQHPIWTVDGQRIVFASLRAGALNLWAQAADGTGAVERLSTGPDAQWPAFVLPDGTGIIGTEISPHTAGDIVWFKRAANQSAQGTSAGSAPLLVERLVHTKAIEHSPDASPDGRYIAYESEGGIYVRPFPRVTDGSWQVSTAGGSRPLWARNGRELFYLDRENKLTAVPVQTSGRALVYGSPVRVLDTAYARALGNSRPYDVSPNGQRFLMIKEDLTAAKPAALTVVLNWHEELKRLVPAR